MFFDATQELKASMEQQVAAASAATVAATRRQELVAERIRAQCWDAMDAKGSRIIGMKGGLEVANFPLASCAGNDAALKHVSEAGVMASCWLHGVGWLRNQKQVLTMQACADMQCWCHQELPTADVWR